MAPVGFLLLAGGARRWRPRGGRALDADVGVFGATGYAGREAVRILALHPRARVAFTTGTGEGHLTHEAGLERRADAYLLSLPHGISAVYAARLRASHPDAVVIDLSGDLRLPTAEAYRAWYGHDHPVPALLGFCADLLPVRRGILSTIYLRPTKGLDALRVAIQDAYHGSPFVKVIDKGPPRLSEVVYTNQCRISLHEAAPGRAVVFSALD